MREYTEKEMLLNSEGFTSVQKEYVDKVLTLENIRYISSKLREGDKNVKAIVTMMSVNSEGIDSKYDLSEYPTEEELDEILNAINNLIVW